MYFDNKMFTVLNKIKKITKIKYIQSCLKHLKKSHFKNKLRLLGGGKNKKNQKLNLTENDENDSKNVENLNDRRSNLSDTIMNSQTTKQKPGDDMEETIESKRKEKKVDKKYDVDLKKMNEYLDSYGD
jgi:hypothetical protein